MGYYTYDNKRPEVTANHKPPTLRKGAQVSYHKNGNVKRGIYTGQKRMYGGRYHYTIGENASSKFGDSVDANDIIWE